MTDWTEPGVMTDPGDHAYLFDDLPADVPGLFRVVQGLMIHEFWAAEYGVTLPDEPPRETVNLRRVSDLLDAVVRRDDRPLTVAREPAGRIATNCRGFTVMAVAMLRSQGIPARSRCGFGAYFTPGFHEDHWVAEFSDGSRWRLADPQLDSFQVRRLGIGFDVTDVPREQFVVAGEAWRHASDPSRYGLSAIGEGGGWWIAGNLMRDAAALLGVETLPWDTWDGMPLPASSFDESLYDQLAEATAGPDPDAVRRLLPLPEKVHNEQRDSDEVLTSAA
jgi:hypothetical protein